jgi:hypothetical protein
MDEVKLLLLLLLFLAVKIHELPWNDHEIVAHLSFEMESIKGGKS